MDEEADFRRAEKREKVVGGGGGGAYYWEWKEEGERERGRGKREKGFPLLQNQRFYLIRITCPFSESFFLCAQMK